MSIRHFKRFALGLSILLVSSPISLSAQVVLKKVRLVNPTMDLPQLPFKIAARNGFYREQGLEVEMILVPGAMGVKAVLGGSADYTSASGAVITAAIRGVGMKLVLIDPIQPPFDLVSQPDINSVNQLRNKVIGLSSRGGLLEQLTGIILERNGLRPDKDVKLIVVGRQSEIVLALKAKRIDAALVNSPLELVLYREGFSKLAFAGDYANTPAAGIGLTDKKLKDNPDEVSAFVKGTLMGIQYFKQNRSEAINFIIKELAVKDPLLAAQIYDTRVGLFAGSRLVEEGYMKEAIELVKKGLGETKDIPTSHVFDFSFIQKALR
jgi:NitT/TauT family transport system substrate-binding protein